MIRNAKKLYCDNEHGVGDMFFPSEGDYINGTTARELRRLAKLVGWLHSKGVDYCPDCAIDHLDLTEEQKEDRRVALERRTRA